MPYVSRGGLKLEKALETFDIDCTRIKLCLILVHPLVDLQIVHFKMERNLSLCFDVGYNQLSMENCVKMNVLL